MELKEKMYVRTKNEIVQIDKMLNGVMQDTKGHLHFGDFIKASNNIGELLEAGDFLDYHCIAKIEGTTIFLKDGWYIDFDDVEDLVETIVTKEQFESMSYKVGE